MCTHTHRQRETERHAHSFELLPPRKSFPSCIVRFVVCSEVRLCLYLFLSVCVCVFIAPFQPFPPSTSAFCFTHSCLFFGQPDKDLTRYCKTAAAATVTPPPGCFTPFPSALFLCMASAYTHTSTHHQFVCLAVCFCSPGLHFASMLHKLCAVKI